VLCRKANDASTAVPAATTAAVRPRNKVDILRACPRPQPDALPPDKKRQRTVLKPSLRDEHAGSETIVNAERCKALLVLHTNTACEKGLRQVQQCIRCLRENADKH
jgi:hypothetical protein